MTKLTDTERETLADRIRREALIADRPGQLGRLEQIANEVSDIVFRLARVEAECERANARGDIHVPVARLRAALAAPTPTEVQP